MTDDYDHSSDWMHVNDIPDLSNAKSQLKSILSILYGNGDASSLEDHLEELCAELDMKMPLSYRQGCSPTITITRSY